MAIHIHEMRRRIFSLGIVFSLCFGSVLFLLPGLWSEKSEEWALLPTKVYLSMLWNSLLVSGGATVLSLAAGVCLALILFKFLDTKNRWKMLLMALAAVPLYLFAAVWMFNFPSCLSSEGAGEIGSCAAKIGYAAVISGLAKIPLATILLGLSLWGIHPDVEEAAWIEGGRKRALLHIIFPHMGRGLLFAGAVIFGLSLGEISVTDMLAIRTLAEETYMQFQLTLQPSVAAFSGLLVFLPLFFPALCILTDHMSGKDVLSEPMYARSVALFRDIDRLPKWICILFAWLVLILVVGVPLFVYVFRLDPLFVSFSMLFDLVCNEFFLSVRVACCASLFAILIAFPIVYMNRGKKMGILISSMALMGLFVPGGVLGIALVKLFNNPGLFAAIYNSSTILILGQAIRYFPLTVLVLWVFLRNVPQVYDELTSIEGVGWFQKMFQIYIPICRNPLLWTWALTFIWCMGDLDTSLIVCPPGTTTLPIRIFTTMHYGLYGEVALACLLQLGFCVFSMWLLLRAGDVPSK